MTIQKYRPLQPYLWKISDDLPPAALVFAKAVHLCRAQGQDAEQAYKNLQDQVRSFGANAVIECRTEPRLRAPGIEACGRAAVIGIPSLTGQTKEEMLNAFRQPPPASATEARYEGKRWQVIGCMIVAGLLVLLMGILFVMWMLGLVA